MKITDFTVVNRNPGHWDIFIGNKRAFRIRGSVGKVDLIDERGVNNLPQKRLPPLEFNSVAGAMAWIIDELMYEVEDDSQSKRS
jgi:hypothetical protein